MRNIFLTNKFKNINFAMMRAVNKIIEATFLTSMPYTETGIKRWKNF